VHLFCIYHLSCNVYTHVHPLFTGKLEEWKHAHDLFWKIAKETDRNTQCCFDSDWAVLLEYVEGALDAGEKRDAALVWLRDLGGLAKQWAARFTWESITWGVHSTQRAESMQMIVKGFLKATTCVSQLAIDIEQYNARARHLRAEDDVRKALRQHASSVVLPPWAAPWREKLTPYGFDLFAAQFTQALQYSVSVIVNDGAPPSYKVVIMVLSGASVPLVYDEDGHVTSYADLAEFGLDDESHLRARPSSRPAPARRAARWAHGGYMAVTWWLHGGGYMAFAWVVTWRRSRVRLRCGADTPVPPARARA
jgi:hypothetical protein